MYKVGVPRAHGGNPGSNDRPNRRPLQDPREGGEGLLLSRTVAYPYSPRFSRDGQSIYYTTRTEPREEQGVWKLSLVDGKVSRLTKLEGRRGTSGYDISTDGRYLYFTWSEDDGDIWVMDVAH
jgi:Tol biopolymer transport system component